MLDLSSFQIPYKLQPCLRSSHTPFIAKLVVLQNVANSNLVDVPCPKTTSWHREKSAEGHLVTETAHWNGTSMDSSHSLQGFFHQGPVGGLDRFTLGFSANSARSTTH